MADIHYFDVNVAMKYGVNCAVLLQNIWHWVKKNEANGTNFHDGYYWTYNSTRAFAELFPYLTKRQIEKALTTLKDDGIIKTGNYNALQYDRTLWYTVTEKGKCILLVGEMEITEKGNGNPPEVTPIPNINANINPDNKPYIFIVDYLNEKAGTKYKATTPKTKAAINARLSEGYTVDDFQKVVDNKCTEWLGTEWEKYLRPETLFGTKFEGYLNAKVSRKTISTGMNPEEDDLAGIF